MSYGTIRPYEISLWTLQDGFITVLKPAYGDFKGQLITPKLSLKNNVSTLNFSIPAKYRNENGELIDNPLWYDVSNGNLIVNLRKIKVIINKGEEGEEVFEFIIHKAEDSHKGGILTCDVEAEWLAFEELGKIGYKLCLNYDEFLIDLEKQEKENNSGEEPNEISFFPTLNYWADKIFANTNWDYSIQMDWTSYDGIIDLDANGNIYQYDKTTDEGRKKLNDKRENQGLRRRDKIYEEEYNSSWYINATTDKLEPKDTVQFQEKSRIPEIEKSNIFNITQELAELFGVFVRYKYYYDENYHITKRECIFYNNFLDELNNKFDINYGYQTNEITRLIESADVITKLYIPTTEDNSIIDVGANRSKEDYILNFDYLHMAGAITDEQYNSIPDYERKIYELNTDYKNSSDKANRLNTEIVKLKAEKTVLENSITYAEEQISDTNKLLQSITNNSGTLKKTEDNPELLTLLPSEENTFKVALSLEGIHHDTIHLYANFSENKVSGEIKDFTIVYDEITGNNVVGLKEIRGENAKSGRAYLVCSYTPELKYDNIRNAFILKRETDQNRLEVVNKELTEKEGKLKILEDNIKEKQESLTITRAEFERMMGPALREGSWEAEDQYLKYGEKHSVKDLFFPSTREDARAFWDLELFDEEQDNFYETGINQVPEYYQTFEITYDIYSKIKDNLEKYTLYFETPFEDETIPPQKHFLGYGSSYNFFFLTTDTDGKKVENVKPFIMIIDPDKNYVEGSQNFALGITEFNDNNNELVLKMEGRIALETTLNPENYKMVYPRIEINDSSVNDYKDELVLTQKEGNIKLKEYTDFSMLMKENEKTYLTIKPTVFLKGDIIYNKIIFLSNNAFDLDFTTSNKNLHLYLDGLEVSKTNAFPKVSYTVKVSSVDKSFMQKSYQKLNCIANINDTDLKLKNVQGYISEIELDLDQPWQDTFTVQNYKNKFEDLFSRIVASTEAMRQNQVSYDRASGAFGANGTLNGNILQNTLNSVDLNYAFNNGNLLIDENKGIWACSEEGVVAMRGGGIFCATQKDTYDNWIWNTGITPSGISASLLKAGVIDTNLIRIYSGDNLRFQMNADGLFAYAKNTAGEANYDKYVVHNSEGLFLTEKNVEYENKEGIIQTGDINLVEISWDGLILRNRQNENVFFANPDTGNLEIKGNITAASGNIGKWEIDNEGLIYKIKEQVGVDSDTGEQLYEIKTLAALYPPTKEMPATGNTLLIGDNFKVSKDGTLTATNAVIKGNAIIEKDAIIKGSLTVESTVTVGGEIISLNKALKKMDIMSIGTGNTFKRYNHNLDGNITTDPSSLRFFINQMNFSTLRKDLSFKVEGNEITLDENGSIYWENTSEGSEELIFIVDYKFMDDAVMNKDGIIEKIINISCDYTEKNKTTEEEQNLEEDTDAPQPSSQKIETSLRLTLEKTNIDKSVSQINPPYCGFSLSETEDQSLKTETFEVSLSGFNSVPTNVKWYLNNQEIDENIETINTNKKSSITINASQVIEGQTILKYEIEGVSREAIITKTIVPENNITLVIKSSDGTLFKNGNTKTTLRAAIYENGDEVDKDGKNYGYLWKKIKGTEETIVRGSRNKKEIELSERAFVTRATYICEIYSSQDSTPPEPEEEMS